jgi:uncharacterized protein (DUF58 family)
VISTSSTAAPLVSLSDIAEIELFILKRMRELTLGDHKSVFKGPGFDFVGTRDWQPGDRMSAIDWAQSSLNNFSPLVTREFEQDSTAAIVAVADASRSTRCGAHGVPIAVPIARAVAAAGLSATLFQDTFGLVVVGDGGQPLAAVPPRIGRPHVLYALDVYTRAGDPDDTGPPLPRVQARGDFVETLEGQLRKTTLVPVLSDFLFEDAPRVVGELALLNAVHDVFLVMADVRFAYDLPGVSAGWIETWDIETGTTRVLSRRELRRLAARVGEWQDGIERLARERGIDVVRVGLDRWVMESTLVAFAAERRLRKR